MSRWDDALARAYAETGTKPEPPPTPDVDTDRWNDSWRTGRVTGEERVWFAANGYRHVRIDPESRADRLAKYTPELGWTTPTSSEEIDCTGFAFYDTGSMGGHRLGPIRNWLISPGTTFELWWKP